MTNSGPKPYWNEPHDIDGFRYMPVAWRDDQIYEQLERAMMNRKLLLFSFCLSTVLSSWQLPAQNSQDPSPQQARAQQDKPSETPTGENPTITLPEGYVIPVRVTEEIDSKHGRSGEMYSGSVDPSVLIDDKVVIPRGTEAHLRLVHNRKGGHVYGKAEVTLELVSLIINGQRLEVDSNEKTKKKGALESKGAAIGKKAPSAGGVITGDPSGVAAPVIAAFSAAKVEVKPGSRIEFRLESPFTFEKPPINTNQP